MDFDRQAAKDAGYSDSEIDAFLRKPIEDTQKKKSGGVFTTGAAGNPILENVLQGITFGNSDEIQAGLKSGYEKLTGDTRPISDIYSQNVKDVRQPLEKWNEKNPMKAIGLNIAGGFGAGGLIARGAKKLAPKMVDFAKINPLTSIIGGGAVSGGISGIGYAPTVEEIPKYSRDAAIAGAVLAPVGAAAAKVAGFASTPFQALGRKMAGAADTSDQRAARMVADAFKRDEIGASDIIKKQAMLGDEAKFIDTGGVNVQRLGQTIASTPGKAANIAESTLQSRMISSPERLISRMRGKLNNTSAYRYMKDTIKKRKLASSPLYEKAYNVDIYVRPDSMSGLLKNLNNKISDFDGTSIGTALKKVNRSLYAKQGSELTPKLKIKQLHAAKLDLDVKIASSYKDFRPTPLTAELMQVKNGLVSALDSSESYRQARKLFSDDSSVLNAISAGKKILKTDAEEITDTLKLMSDAEKKGFITGAMQTISDNLSGTKEGANAARKMATPLIKQRLKNAFKDEAQYNNFIQGLEAEDVFAEVRNNVLRGSQTQQRLDTGGVTALEVGADISMGRWASGILDATKSFFRGNSKIPESVKDDIADLLFRNAMTGKTKVSRVLEKRLKRHDISVSRANDLLASFNAGIPVSAGQINPALEGN